MIAQIRNFLKDESGHNMIEYALLAALISMSIVGTMDSAGSTVSNWFNAVSGELTNAGG